MNWLLQIYLSDITEPMARKESNFLCKRLRMCYLKSILEFREVACIISFNYSVRHGQQSSHRWFQVRFNIWYLNNIFNENYRSAMVCFIKHSVVFCMILMELDYYWKPLVGKTIQLRHRGIPMFEYLNQAHFQWKGIDNRVKTLFLREGNTMQCHGCFEKLDTKHTKEKIGLRYASRIHRFFSKI